MAWIEQRSGKYLVRWREKDGIARSEMRRTKDEARRLKAAVESELLSGAYVSKELRDQPFGDYALGVLESALQLRGSTLYTYRGILKNWLEPGLGATPIGSLDAVRLRRFFASMQQAGAQPPIMNKTRRVLSKILQQALREGVIARNPLLGVEVPKEQAAEVRILTPQEVQAVAEAMPGRYQAAVLLAAWGTLRIGEIGALKREHLDLEAGTVSIRQGLSRAGGTVTLTGPKTKASIRTNTLPSWVVAELRQHVLAYADSEGWLFRTPEGKLLTNDRMSTIWDTARRKVFSPPYPRFHDLRHTAVALMIRAGAHPKEIQARCGHTSITVTMDRYGHLFPGADAELVRRLEALYTPGELGKVVDLDGRSHEGARLPDPAAGDRDRAGGALGQGI